MPINRIKKKVDLKTGATKGSKKTPSIFESFVEGERQDDKRIKKAISSKHKATRKAGVRAASRKAGRVGLGVAAFETGKAVGEKIERKTGIGKKTGSALGGHVQRRRVKLANFKAAEAADKKRKKK